MGNPNFGKIKQKRFLKKITGDLCDLVVGTDYIYTLHKSTPTRRYSQCTNTFI